MPSEFERQFGVMTKAMMGEAMTDSMMTIARIIRDSKHIAEKGKGPVIEDLLLGLGLQGIEPQINAVMLSRDKDQVKMNLPDREWSSR